ncbi:MAG: PorV/PorQ family protein [Candidatus Cloacimonetes bacterium]|nr:PorV/PorQ family protein [Candidatus Cloacimonadota bacterium]
MKYLLILLVLLLSCLLYAEIFPQVSYTGVQFLMIPIDARATGMAEAYTAVSDDISSVFWNPAGLVLQPGIQAMYSQRVSRTYSSGKWTENPDYSFMAASIFSKYGAFGVNVSYWNWKMDGWVQGESFGPSEESITYSDLTSGLTYSYQLTDQLSLGITGKYIREEIDRFVAEGQGIDLGLLFKPGFRNISAGITAKNLGPDMRFKIDEDDDGLFDEDPFDLIDNDGDGLIDEDREEMPFKIPRMFSFGVAGEVYRLENICLLASMQIDNNFDYKECSSIGTELQYDSLRLRSGIKMDDEAEYIPLGLGIRIAAKGLTLALDYSYAKTKMYHYSSKSAMHNITVKASF